MSETKAEIKYEITTFGSSATTALAWYFVPATRLTIDSVYCHFSAAPTVADVFEIAYVPAAGFTYAATVYATTPSQTVAVTTKDVAWQPINPLKLKLNDGIKITWTNTSARTYGVTVVAISNEPS